MESPESYSIEPIGRIESPFREKFGTPRQAGLVPAAAGTIILNEPYRRVEMWRGLADFSHIWLIWGFHLVPNDGAAPRTTVRPPRLGGNDRLGVFATRSPFRPNRIGLSCVRLTSLDAQKGTIAVAGIDLVNGTPVFDIKPYVPYADVKLDATSSFAPHGDPRLCSFAITYSDQAAAALAGSEPGFKVMLEQTLRADPRPAYHTGDDRPYGLTLQESNIRFLVHTDHIEVISIEPAAVS
ncbi:MAG: tRNA (N6-threonylcarbamoyladenosine(37)-N6)-methyltransferase TrmO [Verrucomicrobiales bacterium]